MRMAPEELLSVKEVAQWLGVSEAWVRDHCGRKRPRLPVVRLGRVLRFREDDIEQFIRELKEGRAA